MLNAVNFWPLTALTKRSTRPFGVVEEAQRVALVLVGPQVVGADHRFASLVDELGHLLPVGRVAEHHRVGPAAELHPPRQIQVIIQDAADALVGVAR